MTDADALAADAYRHVQNGSWADAHAVIDAALGQCPDRPKLGARLHAWAAQARLAQGDHKAARRRLSAALKLARSCGDPAEVTSLAPLQAQVMAAWTARSKPADVPDTPAGRAVAAYDRGDLAAGERLARVARVEAAKTGDAREEVLALLALARSPEHQDQAIRDAAAVADARSDHNLVTAVAHAARAAGVHLPPKVF